MPLGTGRPFFHALLSLPLLEPLPAFAGKKFFSFPNQTIPAFFYYSWQINFF